METTGQERRNAIAASQDKLSMGPIQELQERWRRYFEDLPLDSAEHSIEHPHLNVKRGSHQLSDASTPEEGPSSKQMSYIRKDPTDTIEGDTPNLASQGPVRVLILGHSLIDWAASRAKVHQGGLNLGLDPRSCEVIWKGFPGMTWDQLLSVLSHVISEVGQIHVLIVHLGGNDIGNTPKRKLLSNILRDLTTVQQLIPGLLVVWSSVVPRRFWYGANNPAALEIARRFLNHRVARAAPRLGFAVIDHWDFSGKDPVWFNEDGIHLSDIGLDLFNLNLSRHLQALFSHPAVYCPS
ncbi:uncharacterized protein LOC122796503 isoform X2 [Protopterus annectens]|uniref:uncharacterized protein LOC122796503 isoform X2 n=1 Tax=Protopterus annectens TaxID=7888 RepID=UPI001CFA031E|nr:uncharacterized protein LOC122796503 isoform X2 [Protopterus annectens]